MKRMTFRVNVRIKTGQTNIDVYTYKTKLREETTKEIAFESETGSMMPTLWCEAFDDDNDDGDGGDNDLVSN